VLEIDRKTSKVFSSELIVKTNRENPREINL